MLDLDIFLLSCICPSNIGVDLTGILVGTHDGTYYKSPAVEAKKHIFLHCNASNLVFKILIHDKIWGGGTILPPNSGGDLSSPFPRDLRSCLQRNK